MKKVIKTDAEWKKLLTIEQYNILRKKGTESPNSCGLLRNKEKGFYACVAYGNKLFKSGEKFDSGTVKDFAVAKQDSSSANLLLRNHQSTAKSFWPSFSEPYSDESLEYHEDSSFFQKRTEVLCSKCGGHLGHVFDDGPAPSGKRYCINGIVLRFVKKLDD